MTFSIFLWTQLTGHFGADFVGQIIDDVEIFQPHAIALGNFSRLGIGADVKADNRRIAGGGKRHVTFRDRADTAVQDPHLDIVVGNLVQRLDNRLGRALHIRLDQQREFHCTVGCRREHVLQAGRCLCRALQFFLLRTIGRHFAGTRFILDHGQLVTSRRNARQAEHFDRNRWTGFLGLRALVVDHRPDFTGLRADNEDIAAFQRTALDQNGRHRAAALVELCFDNNTFGGPIRTRLELKQFGLQVDFLHQLVEIGLLQRRHFDILHVTGHFLDDHFMFQQTRAHLGRVRAFLVDLVDRHNHRHFGRLGVIDRLDRLRHQAVISSHHQDDDIGRIGTARAACW